MLTFKTKAETLAMLKPQVRKSNVLPQLCFTVADVEKNPDMILREVLYSFAAPLIVRSSSLTEDTAAQSQAGRFLSVFNVTPANVIDAMRQVADSFSDSCPANQIFVQPMLTDIAMSGVLFTTDPNTGGHYYVINYDKSGSTSSVTSGEGQELCTHYIFHNRKSGDLYLDRLIDASNELMELFSNNCLDIEFAFNKAGELYLLQVRPLVITKRIGDYEEQNESILRISSFLKREMRPTPYAKGQRTIYGIMPDWNPAEMIGTRPKPLALSLYKRLITDGIWAYQRDNYGYKNLRGFPLMVDFCGLPYIDTRVSFNSFIPKDIDDDLTEKLADYYLDSLAAQPEKHDKVEFEIIFSCATFDMPQRIKVLEGYSFSIEEQEKLRKSLTRLTNNIINVKDGLWIADAEKMEYLRERRQTIMDGNLDTVSKIYWLLEDCARYGTLPFAGLARAGFIAVLLLKSLVSIGILTEQDYEDYIRQLNTVGSQMAADRKILSISDFTKKYGHLRPGTYDITSMRYDAAPELYFSQNADTQDNLQSEKRPFTLTLEQYSAIQSQMQQRELNGDVLALFKFLKAGIEGREYSKFVFTHSLSDALELLAELGAKYGFSRDDMAFADISIINQLYSSADDAKAVLERTIDEGRQKYAKTQSFVLPPVILKPEDVYSFAIPSGLPNYITLGNITGEVCTDVSVSTAISGKIILIPAADPGYDWIFSHSIKGLVTAFGGTNSHMAIRAGELGIPAVIGAGEKLFNIWKKARILHIDCANKKVEILQ